MAWTTPLTAVANATLTAAQYNATCRDNFLEMEPAKATGTRYGTEAFTTFITTGANALAERSMKNAIVQRSGTGQSTTTTSYTDLYTYGPSVRVRTGTQALVFFGCLIGNLTTDGAAYASVEVSESSSVSASDEWCIELDGHTGASGNDNMVRRGQFKLFTGLSSGYNTFTMKYRAGSGTAIFNFRHLFVWAL